MIPVCIQRRQRSRLDLLLFGLAAVHVVFELVVQPLPFWDSAFCPQCIGTVLEETADLGGGRHCFSLAREPQFILDILESLLVEPLDPAVVAGAHRVGKDAVLDHVIPQNDPHSIPGHSLEAIKCRVGPPPAWNILFRTRAPFRMGGLG